VTTSNITGYDLAIQAILTNPAGGGGGGVRSKLRWEHLLARCRGECNVSSLLLRNIRKKTKSLR
jgi:hypothetical protein